jgi:hypothetical protein
VPTNSAASVGVGIDSTSVNSAQLVTELQASGTEGLAQARYKSWPGIGYHYAAWLEYTRSASGGNATWYGDAAVVPIASGITGVMWG